jgi:hypothetical protein
MKTSKYLGCFLKDFFTAYGFLMVISAMFLVIYSTETITASLPVQIILVALSFTFFKFAFVNKYELEKKAQRISFAICFLLADMPIVLWLFFFSPGKLVDLSVLLAYIIVILIVKGAVCAMMYIDGNRQAKQVNEKLREYKNEGSL